MRDAIDFPVSSTWLNHYHSQGLTPRYAMFDEHGNYLGDPHDFGEQITELTNAVKGFRYRVPPPIKPRKDYF